MPAVAFSPDGKVLASAGKDNAVTLWDPATGRVLRSLTGFGGQVQAAAFSPDGRLLATGDWAGGVRIHDAGSGKWLASLDHDLGRIVWSVAFSPDGRFFAAGGGEWGSYRAALWRVVPADGGAPGFRLLRRAEWASPGFGLSLAFSPDGAALAWVVGNTLRLWDPATARDRLFPRVGLAGNILSTAFFPDGKRLVFVAETGTAEVWDWAAGRRAFALGGEGGMPLGANIALSADGAWLASNHGKFVSIWDTKGHNLLAVLPQEHSPTWCLAWSPDRRLLAVGSSDGGLVIWNLPRIRSRLAELRLDW